MSAAERIARLIVAALLIGVFPLVGWSGGCSRTLAQPDASAGGTGGASGVGGTTGVGGTNVDASRPPCDSSGGFMFVPSGDAGACYPPGGAGGQSGGTGGASGQGGTGNADAGLQCCTPPVRDQCSADQRQIWQCRSVGQGQCITPSSYNYVLTLVDCPNGCVVTDGGADASDHCYVNTRDGGCSPGPDRCNTNLTQLQACRYADIGGYDYWLMLWNCANGCIPTDAGADANDYCR